MHFLERSFSDNEEITKNLLFEGLLLCAIRGERTHPVLRLVSISSFTAFTVACPSRFYLSMSVVTDILV